MQQVSFYTCGPSIFILKKVPWNPVEVLRIELAVGGGKKTAKHGGTNTGIDDLSL